MQIFLKYTVNKPVRNARRKKLTFNETKANLKKQRSKEKIEKTVLFLFPRVVTNMKRYIKYNFKNNNGNSSNVREFTARQMLKR